MFLGESGSGHSVVMDGPEDHGGRNMGIRPMEMLLVGMGGCASFDANCRPSAQMPCPPCLKKSR